MVENVANTTTAIVPFSSMGSVRNNDIPSILLFDPESTKDSMNEYLEGYFCSSMHINQPD